ncbi:hypothetical protein D1007_52299 [Hordeum vulgare]|nr:hypothetical protein D1007_52299 [Hordeum vulgare]
MRAYISKRDGNVVNPAVGTEFDSLDEAYQFYNLYSWEVGFGIRFAKSRLNVNIRKCMQEIVCGCAFDRESEESFQEKRTSLSGVYLKVNLPIERHASKIYTRAMFEQFGESLYKAGAYEIDVVKAMKLYHLTWTKDARDILPEHLARYHKDKGPRGYKTYRHNAMYIKPLECVRLGDSNVKCYDVFMAMMKEVYTTLLPLSQGKDGMGLEEREAAQGRPGADGTYASIPDATNFMKQCETMSNCSGIAPASSKRPARRPTASREKAPYEHKQKRSCFCKYVVVRDTRAQPVSIEAICQNHQGKCSGAQSVV